MKDNKDIQLIEDYLDGLLKGKKLEDFLKRLKNDEDFAKEYKPVRIWPLFGKHTAGIQCFQIEKRFHFLPFSAGKLERV